MSWPKRFYSKLLSEQPGEGPRNWIQQSLQWKAQTSGFLFLFFEPFVWFLWNDVSVLLTAREFSKIMSKSVSKTTRLSRPTAHILSHDTNLESESSANGSYLHRRIALRQADPSMPVSLVELEGGRRYFIPHGLPHERERITWCASTKVCNGKW